MGLRFKLCRGTSWNEVYVDCKFLYLISIISNRVSGFYMFLRVISLLSTLPLRIFKQIASVKRNATIFQKPWHEANPAIWPAYCFSSRPTFPSQNESLLNHDSPSRLMAPQKLSWLYLLTAEIRYRRTGFCTALVYFIFFWAIPPKSDPGRYENLSSNDGDC